MINLIIGKKGSGKTKKLIELSNNLLKKTPGNVVVIVDDDKINFDLNHEVRLVNIKNYSVTNFCGLYGFICGICAENYDVAEILIDSIFHSDEFSARDLISFIEKLNLVCQKSKINVTLALSAELADLPSEIMNLVNIK